MISAEEIGLDKTPGIGQNKRSVQDADVILMLGEQQEKKEKP